MTDNEQTHSLITLLSAAAILSGAENKTQSSPDVSAVLKSRLVQVQKILQETDYGDLSDVELKTLQYLTAKECLRLLESMQVVLDPESSSVSPEEPPLLSTRDISYIRILLSVVFKWAILPLQSELELTRPGVQGAAPPMQPRIIDLTERSIDFRDLPAMLIRVFKLIFTDDGSSRMRQSWITSSILSKHAVEILMPSLVVGWAKEPLVDGWAESGKEIKEYSIRFVKWLRPNQAISALGTILADITPKRRILPHVSRVCGFLLSKQLARVEGVRGLCIAVFGEEREDSETAPLEKLEHISRLLSAVPASATPQDYFRSMIPRILALIFPANAQKTPPSHKQAAAFALSRMLSSKFQYHAIVSNILLPLLHDPFLRPSPLTSETSTKSIVDGIPSKLSPVEALLTLQTFFLHTDPSPTELSTLLTPIASELYTLLGLYRSSKTADPSTRESLGALLSTWGRVVVTSDVIAGLWGIISGEGGNWEVRFDGFVRAAKPPPQPSISLFTAASLGGKSKDDIDIDANPLNLRPDPSQFAAFLKALDRKDISSEIFVRLLDSYLELKDESEEPLRTLLYLQLILQMQAQLSSSVLSKPEHVVSFVKHALSTVASATKPAYVLPKKGLGLADLRIVEQEDEDVDEGMGDSDDEDVDEMDVEELVQGGGGKDEMIVTAVTLLLSILEGHPNITPTTTPDLIDILFSLESLTNHPLPNIRQLSREARLVLTARNASIATGPTISRSAPQPESAQAAYQQALKLLQDPIIPVRAHGLQILRDLLSRPAKSKASDTDTLDPALLPALLSIFLQSIQDEESYIFLNAVQGLAAMVDGYGKEVLRGLMDVYLVGTGIGGGGNGSEMGKDEMDARIRVGEALSIVVRKYETILGAYMDILVPPLLTIIRTAHLPATLRSSALSILAECANTNVKALEPYAAGLADTCVELVKLESVPIKSSEEIKPKRTEEKPKDEEMTQDDEVLPEMLSKPSSFSAPEPRKPAFPLPQPASRPTILDATDTNPTTTQSKASPLRRAALHLFTLLLRAYIGIIYEDISHAQTSDTPQVRILLDTGEREIQIKNVGRGKKGVLPVEVLKRARIVFGYVSVTDEDGVVRAMAREAGEMVTEYEGALVGI